MPIESSSLRFAQPSPTPACLSIGWREWVTLPMLGIVAIKAKLDTGARSSSLHVEALEPFVQDGVQHVRFMVRPRRRGARLVACQAPVVDRRPVTDSGGHRSDRWFIESAVAVAGMQFTTAINLTDRRAMLFPLLLGRSALHGRFSVDAALSYTSPRPPRTGAAPT